MHIIGHFQGPMISGPSRPRHNVGSGITTADSGQTLSHGRDRRRSGEMSATGARRIAADAALGGRAPGANPVAIPTMRVAKPTRNVGIGSNVLGFRVIWRGMVLAMG